MANNISSGGIGAIISTLKHASQRTGLLRGSNALMHMNKPDGFDCPGCAWPEPKDRSAFEFCENGAKTLMNATTTKTIDGRFAKKYSLQELASWSEHQLCNSGRIVEPLLKKPNSTHLEPISFQDAYKIASKHFKNLSSPDKAVLYTSGRTSNEAAFLYQLFARLLGTNNLCDCSNLCHESSGVALKKTIGVGKGTVQIDDFVASDVIFLIGHNPSSNHPRMLTTLQEARKNGAQIVVINPLVEPGLKQFRHPQKVGDILGSAATIATHYYQVKVGGDYALFLAIAHELLFDRKFGDRNLEQAFIKEHTSGFLAFKDHLATLDFDELVNDSGLTRKDINALVKLIATHDRVIYAWGMGITQTTQGVHTIETIANLALMRGHIGKPGAGLCPVRGHSNVQGNRTVGITEKPTEAFLSRLSEVFHFSPPTQHGLDVVNSIHAMLLGKVDIFMALGGNFLSAGPDTAATEQALKNCPLAINIATSLNRTHLVAGQMSLIIPCLTRVEKDVQQGIEQIVSVENSMSIVHSSRGHFEPIRSTIPSEVTIVAQIAKGSLKPHKHIDWQAFNDDYGLIRNRMAQCLDGFLDYNERLQSRDGFLLVNGASIRKFPTENGKAQFSFGQYAQKSTDDYDLLLTTIRSHDQFNTAVYGLDDRYRNIKGERRVVFMNRADIARFGLCEGQTIELCSTFNGSTRSLSGLKVTSYDIKVGCAAMYFPEGNALVPLDSVALESNTPTSKLVPVTINR
jgi:molybdopterin-dependent oxidoreductase alpha subunit